MALPQPWADLPPRRPELLLCITDRLTALRCYLAVRGVSSAWRLIRFESLTDKMLATVPACASDRPDVLLMNPLTGQEVGLCLPVLPRTHMPEWWPDRFPWPVRVFKAVFSNPRDDDFTAVLVVRSKRRLAWIRAGDAEWRVHEKLPAGGWWQAELADVVVHHDGKFYRLCRRGDVYALNLPRHLQHNPKPVLELLSLASTPSSFSDHMHHAKYLVF